MKNYIDVSIEADEFDNPIELDSEDAVIEALNTWLQSSRNDYLMSSGIGGPLDHMVFKNINDTMEEAQFLLEIEVRKNFGQYINLNSIKFEPDHDQGIMRIQLSYNFNGSQDVKGSEVYIRQSKLKPNYETFYEITDTGSNLVNFILLYKPNFPNDILEYDYVLDVWRWGPFKLINLSSNSSEYSQILSILNI